MRPDRFRMKTLRLRLTVSFVALLFLTVGAVGWVTAERTGEALERQIVETHRAQAGANAAAVADLVADAMRIAEDAAGAAEFRAPAPPTGEDMRRARLATAVSRGPFVGAIFVGGNVSDVVEAPEGLLADVFADAGPDAQDRFVATIAAIGQAAARPHIARWPEPGAWSVLAPVRDDDGTTFGTLLFQGGAVRPETHVGVGARDARSFVVDAEGIVIGGPEGVEGDDVRKQRDRLIDRSDRTAIVTIGGTSHLATLFPLDDAPWTLILATPSATAFAAVDDLLRAIALVTIVLLVFAVFLTGLLAHQVTAPVRRLRRAARRVTEGEYGTQVRASGRDELTELSAAFNAMSAKMHEDRLRLLRHQEELERTVEERTAALLEKNAELEMFVYAVSHDLKTPLVSLDWLTEDLADALRAAEVSQEAVETLERMRANIDAMGVLVENLLDLARIGKTGEPPRHVPLQATLDAVLEELEPQRRERGVALRREDGPDAALMGDPSHIHRLLSNLVGNAIKYSADHGGAVRITTALDPGPDGDVWRCEVADNGPGIPEALREQVFQPFVRAPDARARRITGTGIGLAIVRKVARTYGGTVEATDAPEGGALFRLRLPLPRDLRDRQQAPDEGASA